jgi:hypothetical protein
MRAEMRRVAVLAILTLLSAEAVAETAVQEDWSGFSGVYGPVLQWSDDFYEFSGIDPDSLEYLQLDEVDLYNTVTTAFDGAFSINACDIDLDGDLDVLGGSYAEGETIRWWRNSDGSGSLWEENDIDVLPYVRMTVCSDIDGDSYPDAAASGSNTVIWAQNPGESGTSWVHHTVRNDFLGTQSVDAGQIDSDALTDIVAGSSSELRWWRNTDGSGSSWTEYLVDNACGDIYYLELCDLNGDGDKDILGSIFTGMKIYWWENTDGEGTSWTRRQIGTSIMDPRNLDACDVDGDGDTDVIGTGYDEVLWWENQNGAGTSWETHFMDEDFLGAHDVSGADLDGDGDNDVITCSFNTEEILWWENLDGEGTSWSEHLLDGSFEDAVSCMAADMDGDGDPDPLGAAYVDAEIAWWNLHCHTEGYLESSVLDTESDPDWQLLESDCLVPDSTTVTFQLRCSDDYGDMGPWSDSLQTPVSLEGILEDGMRYLQYRINLRSLSHSATPVVDGISVSWNMMGVEGDISNSQWISLVSNPASGSAVIAVNSPAEETLVIGVYDVCGRMVWNCSAVLHAGENEIRSDPLAAGAYFIDARTSSGSWSRKLVVL